MVLALFLWSALPLHIFLSAFFWLTTSRWTLSLQPNRSSFSSCRNTCCVLLSCHSSYCFPSSINQFLNIYIVSNLSNVIICHEIEQSNYKRYGLIHYFSSHCGRGISKIVSNYGGILHLSTSKRSFTRKYPFKAIG